MPTDDEHGEDSTTPQPIDDLPNPVVFRPKHRRRLNPPPASLPPERDDEQGRHED